MIHHTFAGSPGSGSPAARPAPPAWVMLRLAVASSAGLLLVLGLFLAGRRLGGAFDQPLSWPAMLALGAGITALACCLRAAWPRAADGPAAVSGWVRLLLPSAVMFLFCYALSLPGSAPWAVALLWFLVVCEEGAWWLAGSPALTTGWRHGPAATASPAAATVSPAAADATGHASRPGPTHEARGDVTQQMTRVRDSQGRERVFGQARAEFVSGERSQSIHLAFCPPLDGNPRITARHAGGHAAAITVAQAESFGARFDVRLAGTARQAEHVMIEFEARSKTASEPPQSN